MAGSLIASQALSPRICDKAGGLPLTVAQAMLASWLPVVSEQSDGLKVLLVLQAAQHRKHLRERAGRA